MNREIFNKQIYPRLTSAYFQDRKDYVNANSSIEAFTYCIITLFQAKYGFTPILIQEFSFKDFIYDQFSLVENELPDSHSKEFLDICEAYKELASQIYEEEILKKRIKE